MSARVRFLAFVEAQLGKPCVWGHKGPLSFDCSGLVTSGIKAAGGPDWTTTHNADRLASETRPLLPNEEPMPGDLIFFDAELDGVEEHVGIYVTPTCAIDAEGATSKVTSAEEAVKRGAMVRKHTGPRYRKSFRAIHRNTVLDSIDFVTR